jgi:hypothetical protein
MELRNALDSLAQYQILWFVAGMIVGAIAVGTWGRK